MNEEQARMLREIHEAVCKPRPTVGQAAAVATTTRPAHDPSDPVVKLLPKSWKGEDYRGRRYSETSAAFLGMLSQMLDAFADKNAEDTDPQKQRYAKWDRENAQKAREWRAKLQGTGDALGNPAPASQRELDEVF